MSTPGSPILYQCTEAVIANLPKKIKEKLAENLLLWPEIYQDDIVMQVISQNHWTASEITLLDSYFLSILDSLIESGELYLDILDVDHWAFNDKCIDKNHAILSKHSDRYDFWIKSGPNAGADGFLQAKTDFSFLEITESEQKKAIRISNYCGPIEIGTNSIAKSVYALISRGSLIRLPYPISGIDPCMFLFYNSSASRIKSNFF